MSGPDLTGAVQACHAARNDIREMQADDAEAFRRRPVVSSYPATVG
jgi:hypothetical protein